MKNLSLIFIIPFILLTSSCKKEEIYEKVTFRELGNEEQGKCGKVICFDNYRASCFKPISIPDSIITYGGKEYWVKLKHLNKKIECEENNVRIELHPDSVYEPIIVEYELVEILDIREIE